MIAKAPSCARPQKGSLLNHHVVTDDSEPGSTDEVACRVEIYLFQEDLKRKTSKELSRSPVFNECLALLSPI